MWDDTILGLAREVGAALQQRGALVTTAESCTGGLIAAALTEIAGSSAWFQGALVAYDNRIKNSQLGVPAEMLAQQGAVSEPVAAAMALGALQRFQATWAVAVSGIAGPGGAVPGKPVGTVCFGLAHHDALGQPRSWVQTRHFSGDRAQVRLATVQVSLQWLLLHVQRESIVV